MVTVGVALHGALGLVAVITWSRSSRTARSTYGTPQVVPPTDGHTIAGSIYSTGVL